MKAVPSSPILDEAAIVFLPGDAATSSKYAVSASPSVRMGVKLEKAEAEVSSRRGGHGVAAALAGGSVTLVPRADAPFIPEQRALSFYIRACDRSGKWNALLLSERDLDGRLRFTLFSSATGLVFELRTSFRDRPLHMEAPFSLIRAKSWHDIVGRYTGPHAVLFVDGELVDEEWPSPSASFLSLLSNSCTLHCFSPSDG